MDVRREQGKQNRVGALLALTVVGIAIASGVLSLTLPLDHSLPGMMAAETKTFIMLALFGTASFALGYHFRFRS